MLHGDHFSGQPVLLTGGAGFIGSHLAIALNELGAKVTVLDDLSGGGDPKALAGGIEFVRGSILDLALLEKCVRGRGVVFHQAALGSVPQSMTEPVRYQEVNSTGTLNVLETARKCGVRRVMFAASSSAYGDAPELPKVETMAAHAAEPVCGDEGCGRRDDGGVCGGDGGGCGELAIFQYFRATTVGDQRLCGGYRGVCQGDAVRQEADDLRRWGAIAGFYVCR